MLPLKRLAGHQGDRLKGSKQATGRAVRSTHVVRRSVAEAPVNAAANEAPLIPRVLRTRRLFGQQRRIALPAEDVMRDAGEPRTPSSSSSSAAASPRVGPADDQDAATTASLRDATATASSSGHDHLPLNGHSHSLSHGNGHGNGLPRQRNLRLAPASSLPDPTATSATAAVPSAGADGSHHSAQSADIETAETAHDANGAGEGSTSGAAAAAAAAAAEGQEEVPEEGDAGRANHVVPTAASVGHWMPPHVTPERDKDIREELMACEDWRDVLDVLADEGSQLSLRTGVQALTRLNALSRGSGEAREEIRRAPAFQALLQHLFSLVSYMNNIQLSNTLYGFAQLHVPLSDVVLASYWEAAAARVDTFYPRDIATFFQAAAALHASPPQPLLDALSFRATAFMSAGEFEPRITATLLHSCVLLGYKNNILAGAAAELLARPGTLGGLGPQSVANAMWALGRMGHFHEPAVRAALDAFVAAPLSYKPQECANLLWALTAFRFHPEGAFIEFARSMLHKANQLRGADLATLLYAMGTFNVAPEPRVMAQLEARIGSLLSQPGSSVKGVELANMYWGLALMGEVRRPLFGQLGRALADHAEAGGDFPPSLQRMVFQGFLAARLSDEDQRPPPFSSLWWDAMKRSWYDNIMQYAAAADSAPAAGRRRAAAKPAETEDGNLIHASSVRGLVGNILKKLQVRHDQNRITGDRLAVIDFALKAEPDRYIALQILEKEERCVNSKQLLGNTLLQRNLLDKNGWEVRHIVAQDLESLAPEMQPLFIAELLRRCGVKVRKPAGREGGPAAAAAAPGQPQPQPQAAKRAAAAAADRRQGQQQEEEEEEAEEEEQGTDAGRAYKRASILAAAKLAAARKRAAAAAAPEAEAEAPSDADRPVTPKPRRLRRLGE